MNELQLESNMCSNRKKASNNIMISSVDAYWLLLLISEKEDGKSKKTAKDLKQRYQLKKKSIFFSKKWPNKKWLFHQPWQIIIIFALMPDRYTAGQGSSKQTTKFVLAPVHQKKLSFCALCYPAQHQHQHPFFLLIRLE